jgi:hypothetical protein
MVCQGVLCILVITSLQSGSAWAGFIHHSPSTDGVIELSPDETSMSGQRSSAGSHAERAVVDFARDFRLAYEIDHDSFCSDCGNTTSSTSTTITWESVSSGLCSEQVHLQIQVLYWVTTGQRVHIPTVMSAGLLRPPQQHMMLA